MRARCHSGRNYAGCASERVILRVLLACRHRFEQKRFHVRAVSNPSPQFSHCRCFFTVISPWFTRYQSIRHLSPQNTAFPRFGWNLSAHCLQVFKSIFIPYLSFQMLSNAMPYPLQSCCLRKGITEVWWIPVANEPCPQNGSAYMSIYL